MRARLPAALVLSLAALASCKMGPSGSSTTGPAVDLPAAVASALQQRPGRAVEAKMKTKDGIVSFEVDVLGQDGLVADVELGADGKPATALPWQKQDAPKARPELAAMAPSLHIDLGTALRTALQASPGTARSVDLSTSKGTPQWKVKIWTTTGQEAEIRIDARTGQVVL